MFYGLSNITNINFTNLDTSSVTSMALILFKCYALKSLNLSNFNIISSVTNMGYMFSYYIGLK